MALVLTSPPAIEPVSVAEAKTYCRIEGDAEDVLISSLILTSRLHIEAALGLALITQSWTLLLDRWPSLDGVPIPLRPVQMVTGVQVLAADGSAMTVSPDDYITGSAASPPRLVRNGTVWPEPGRAVAGIEIAFTAGYGAAPEDVPAPICQALLMLVAHWYEHRDPIEIGSGETVIPSAVSELLMPYRVKRL